MSSGPARRLTAVEMSEAAWVLGPAVSRADAPWLCAQLADRLRGAARSSAATPYTVDISGVAELDVGTVETLALLQLTARRFGRRLTFMAGGGALRLRELLALTGLDAVLPLDPD